MRLLDELHAKQPQVVIDRLAGLQAVDTTSNSNHIHRLRRAHPQLSIRTKHVIIVELTRSYSSMCVLLLRPTADSGAANDDVADSVDVL